VSGESWLEPPEFEGCVCGADGEPDECVCFDEPCDGCGFDGCICDADEEK